MPLTRSHRVAPPPEVVADILDSEAFLLARARHDPAFVSARVERRPDGATAVVSTVYGRSKTGTLDRSRTESSTLLCTWDAARRVRTWRWSGDTVVKVDVVGTWTLRPEGTGTHIDSHIEVTVHSRLLRRAVEPLVARNMERSEDALPGDILAHSDGS